MNSDSEFQFDPFAFDTDALNAVREEIPNAIHAKFKSFFDVNEPSIKDSEIEQFRS